MNKLDKIVSSSLIIAAISFATPATASPYKTDWVAGHNSRARLIVGGAPGRDGTMQRYAALELALAPGWKTYWRQPGSAGGIPPQMSWEGSVNLKRAALKYPAPIRMTDPTGDTIGYKHSVVFPIEIDPLDAAAPVTLAVKAFFGVCREICIPAEAAFNVTLEPGIFRQTPPELNQALLSLPVKAGNANSAVAGTAPSLVTVKEAAAGASKHALIFDVRFPDNALGADLFAETGDEKDLPQGLAMSRVIARPAPGIVRFEVIVDDSQWRELEKSGLLITAVSEIGASETRLPRP